VPRCVGAHALPGVRPRLLSSPERRQACRPQSILPQTRPHPAPRPWRRSRRRARRGARGRRPSHAGATTARARVQSQRRLPLPASRALPAWGGWESGRLRLLAPWGPKKSRGRVREARRPNACLSVRRRVSPRLRFILFISRGQRQELSQPLTTCPPSPVSSSSAAARAASPSLRPSRALRT